jgi:hypothetical protein
MTPIEIVLILIGVGLLVISMFFVDKSNSKNSTILNDKEFYKDENGIGKITEEDMEVLKKKVDLSLSGVSEEVLQMTEDKLSHLSNEKIIAVTDYSNLVLEKINQNHEEVIFLYNMLNEKESEIKNLMKQVESTKKEMKAESQHDIHNANTIRDNTVKNKITLDNSIHKANLDSEINANSNPIVIKNMNETKTNKLEDQQIELDQLIDGNVENNNEKILELYKMGNSIVEISKLLEIGQGEVKLVIDLFNKKR